jgi:hypothetical protein
MTLQSASERDRDCARRKAQRVRQVKVKVQEFLALNCTLAETAQVIEDLYQHVRNVLRREQRHREARQP